MATTAIIISLNNQPYYYDYGVYYVEADGGYNAVPPPTNIIVNTLPEGMETLKLNDDTFYYFGGAFYTKSGDDYQVIDAPDGAVIKNLPDGAEEQEISEQIYVVYHNTYYQPLLQDGENLYQVVSMEATDSP